MYNTKILAKLLFIFTFFPKSANPPYSSCGLNKYDIILSSQEKSLLSILSCIYWEKYNNRWFDMEKLLPEIEKIISPIIEDTGVEIVEMNIAGVGNASVIRIFVHKPGGINISDISKISRKVSEALDKSDLIQHKYFLEVSSPGLDRKLRSLKDFIRAISENVRVVQEGGATIEGVLIAANMDKLSVLTKNGEIDIQFDTVAVGKIVI